MRTGAKLLALLTLPLGSAPVPCDMQTGACGMPALDARWEYRPEGNAGQFESTGGNVDICAVPFTGGPALISP